MKMMIASGARFICLQARCAGVCATLAGTLLSAVGARAGDCQNFHDPRYVYEASVVRVHDGDTVYMDIDLGFRVTLQNEPLRLWGVDTPEVRGEEKAEGEKVRDLVRSWLPDGSNQIIRTLKDKGGEDRTGTFHRYLAIICPEGWPESVNARLLKEGHGRLDAQTKKDRAAIIRIFELEGLE